MIQQWFEQLATREKMAIILGTIVVIIMLVYFLWWSPLIEKKQQLLHLIEEQQNTLRWMYSAAEEIRQLQTVSTQSTGINTTSLLTLIDSQTQTLGNVNKRIEPQGEHAVQISFEAVNFSAFIQWLAELYNQHHVQVTAITIDSLSTDQVKIRVTLQYRV